LFLFLSALSLLNEYLRIDRFAANGTDITLCCLVEVRLACLLAVGTPDGEGLGGVLPLTHDRFPCDAERCAAHSLCPAGGTVMSFAGRRSRCIAAVGHAATHTPHPIQ